MAYWFGDSFDLYSAITDCATYWDATLGPTASVAISASGRFAGSRGLNTNTGSGSTTPYLPKTSGINDAVHHISVAIQQTSTLSGTFAGFFCTFYDGATAQCSVLFLPTGNLVLASGSVTGTVLATYTGAIAATNTWYQFEIEVVINNTTGSISVRRNGNTSNDFFLGSLNTRNSANNYANKIGVGSNSGATSTQIADDFLWRSDASSVAWVGDIRCFTRMPAADSSVAWSRPSTFPLSPFGTATTTPANVTAGQARYNGFISQGGSIGSVTVTLQVGYTGNMKCAIFGCTATVLGSGVGAVLGTATAAISNPVVGSNTFTFSPPISLATGTLFYVGICSDTTAANAILNANAGALNSTYGAVSNTAYASFPVASPTLSASNAGPMNFAPVITATGNCTAVADATQDGATTYVYSSTVGQSDLYTISPISTTPASTLGVTTRGYVQKSDAGTRLAAVQLTSGSTNVQATPLALPAGSWAWNWRTDLTDPNTGAAWTATAVNNALIGEIVTA